jgi:hypothetical protein
MRYLVWFNRLRNIAQVQFEFDDWESWGGWRDYYLSGLSPQSALENAFSKNQKPEGL